MFHRFSDSVPEAEVLRVRHPDVDRRPQVRRSRHHQGWPGGSPGKGARGPQGLDVKSPDDPRF